MSISPTVERAYQAALVARKNSYSPYSKFKVGAAIQIAGETITGTNIENASFGATLCAERAALAQAVSRFGKVKPEFVVVVTGEDKATVPCALCLQMLAEFCSDDTPIYLGNEKSILFTYKFKDLLPHPFRAFEVK